MRALIVSILLASPCLATGSRAKFIADYLAHYRPAAPASAMDAKLAQTLSDAALAQTKVATVYDPSYVKLRYPGGDLPAGRGVCTDVIVRAYRKAGIDLQVAVHEDMTKDFKAYPQIYGRDKPDANIDHRRVPNLMVFFSRQGAAVPISKKAEDYRPGDVVAWDLGGGTTHIGLVVEGQDGRPFIVHNIGNGPQFEDVLFEWRIIGHFRFANTSQDG